jgi:hypothetical protein
MKSLWSGREELKSPQAGKLLRAHAAQQNAQFALQQAMKTERGSRGIVLLVP